MSCPCDAGHGVHNAPASRDRGGRAHPALSVATGIAHGRRAAADLNTHGGGREHCRSRRIRRSVAVWKVSLMPSLNGHVGLWLDLAELGGLPPLWCNWMMVSMPTRPVVGDMNDDPGSDSWSH